MQTEAEARAFLNNIHTPKLDAFRESIKTQPFSSLIGWFSNPRALVVLMNDKTLSDEDFQMVCSAAMLVISDELDRRMPVSRLVSL